MDSIFMKQAIVEARKGVGFTSPNPPVGAVLVRKGTIIGAGHTQPVGGAHAEVMAVRDAKKRGNPTKGATLYVTLEPCAHFGRTPPCTSLVIEEKIKKVVVGMKDPFPKVQGRGIAFLKKEGIVVDAIAKSTEEYKDIRKILQPFLKWAMTGLPYITMKAAVSLDGKVATRTKHSMWITSTLARRDARLERSLCDAVLVGSGTAVADDPTLAPHGKWRKTRMLRIIIDPTLSVKTSLNVFRDQHALVATTSQVLEKDKKRFEKVSIEYKSFGSHRVSWKRLFQHLGKKDIQHVYVEGGASVHGSLFDDAQGDPLLIDRVLWYIAPKMIGGAGAVSAVGGKGLGAVPEKTSFSHRRFVPIGQDMKFEGLLNWY